MEEEICELCEGTGEVETCSDDTRQDCITKKCQCKLQDDMDDDS